MANQLTRVAPEYRDVPVPRPELVRWTHALHSSQTLRTETTRLLTLFSEVITLPALSHLAGAIALDWYKQPLYDIDSREWPNTEVGELISRGKYKYEFDPQPQAQVGRDVVGRMCRAIVSHPGLRAADVVLNVPGHDSSQVSFGGRMAATVARDTRKPHVRVRAKDSFRPSAKSAEPEQRAEAVRGQFSVSQSLDGMTALIADDIFRSGESMREVARAAAAAGANIVYGICAVRTMRG
ncbi:MAG: hypothetical protein ACRDRH_02005 [Pseudonocardia sp.]